MKGDKNDRKSAASMKMYGAMTRDSYEWHPDRVVCKRFNIPDPYPGYDSSFFIQRSGCDDQTVYYLSTKIN